MVVVDLPPFLCYCLLCSAFSSVFCILCAEFATRLRLRLSLFTSLPTTMAFFLSFFGFYILAELKPHGHGLIWLASWLACSLWPSVSVESQAWAQTARTARATPLLFWRVSASITRKQSHSHLTYFVGQTCGCRCSSVGSGAGLSICRHPSRTEHFHALLFDFSPSLSVNVHIFGTWGS